MVDRHVKKRKPKYSKEWADRLDKILSIKSIVTLVMTATLVFLLCSGRPADGELKSIFGTAYGAIITYFFTKKEDGNG